MKKITLVLVTLALAVGIFAQAAEVKVADMMAGQTTNVGGIYMWSDTNNTYVKYQISGDGWCISETHLSVADTIEDIPQTQVKKGTAKNPIPGQFQYSAAHNPCISSYTYTLPLIASPKAIAAHAVVQKREVVVPAGCMNVVSDTNTMWSADNGLSGWTSSVPCFVHSAWNKTNLDGATWIWRTYLTDIVGEYNSVPEGGWYFQRNFEIPGKPLSGDIYINADNTYSLTVNGAFMGSEGSLNKVGPDLHEWGTVNHYTLNNLVQGSNVFDIRALNFFNTYDSYSNPAGLAYKANVCYEGIYNTVGSETAWASGIKFPNASNWATYFTYTP